MQESEKLERNDRREIEQPRAEEPSNGASGLLLLVGGAALVLVAYGVIANLADIKRYYKMRNM